MKRRITILFVTLTAVWSLLLMPTVSARQTAEEPQRTISTSGVGTVTAEPDIANFTVGVETRDEDVNTAQNDVTNKANAITTMLREKGIDDKDIVTSSYQVTPQYKYDRNGNFVSTTGYLVRVNIRVDVRDLDIVGALIDETVSLGANYVGSINFGVADPDPFIQQARKLAIADARQKAEDYATGSDSTLTGLQYLYESSSPMPTSRDKMAGDSAPMMEAASADMSNPLDVSAGSLTFTVRIETTWTITPSGPFAPLATPAP